MGVDKSYGSGYMNTGKSKKTATRRQMSAAEKARASAARSANQTPFKGTDPFSKTAATAWSIPGTIAKGFGDVASGRRQVSVGDVAGVLAPALLAAAGMGITKTRVGRRITKAATPAAIRIETASRRVARRSSSAASSAAEQSRRLMQESVDLQKKSNQLYYPTEMEIGGRKRIFAPTDTNINDSRFFGSQATVKRDAAINLKKTAAKSSLTSTKEGASGVIKKRLKELQRLEEEYMKGPKGRKPNPGELKW